MMAECRLCKERGKTWQGSDPRCAFPLGTFVSDNWNCATMGALRDRCQQLGFHWRDDMDTGSFGFLPFATDEDAGFIAMAWYKDRGATPTALIIHDSYPARALTFADAMGALEYTKNLPTHEETND